MIEFSVDNTTHTNVSTQIRGMDQELADVVVVLRKLQKVLSQHELAISSPSVTEYRDELQETISEALSMAQTIGAQSQKLVAVTEQASRHLASLEEHIGSLLRDTSNENRADIAKVGV